MFAVAALGVLATMALALVRAFLGPSVYDRILAQASVAPGSCNAIRITYGAASCVPTNGPAIGSDRIEQATDGEVIVNLDAPVPMGPGERRYFVVTFDLAATLTRSPGQAAGSGTATPENAPAAANGNWVMWPRGRSGRPAEVLKYRTAPTPSMRKSTCRCTRLTDPCAGRRRCR